jgi:uncharacterized protein YjbI with pentapeptide repeats
MAIDKNTGTVTVKGYKIGPNANLYEADLSGADLEGADLTAANLERADLTDADLTDASLLFAGWYGVYADEHNISLIVEAIQTTTEKTIESLSVTGGRAKNPRGRYGR